MSAPLEERARRNLTERLSAATRVLDHYRAVLAWELQHLLELQDKGASNKHAAQWGHARAWEIHCNTIRRREEAITHIRLRIEAIEIERHTLAIALAPLEGGV